MSSANKDVFDGGKRAKKRSECANSMKCSLRWEKNVFLQGNILLTGTFRCWGEGKQKKYASYFILIFEQ